MNSTSRVTLLLASLGLLLAFSAGAEDIELFMSDPSITGDQPNVLLIIDNQSNWSAKSEWPGQWTKQERVEAAVREVLLNRDDLIGKVNLGIMNIGGGPRQTRVIERIQLFDEGRRAESASLRKRIEEMGGSGAYWSSSNSDYGMLMHEAYMYFSGGKASTGSGSRDTSAINASGNYISPGALGSDCAKNYVIFIGTGFPNNDHPHNARNALQALGGNTTKIPLSPNKYEDSWADEFARFMSSAGAAPQINTFVIDVYNPAKSDLGMRAFWQSIAQQGKGDYYSAETVDDLIDALTMSFDSILAVNSVFAASSLPVSVNVRGTNLNQVYMGVFRPDADGKPRWMGNLKLYQLGRDANTSQIYLADANKLRADSPITGFIHENATSFWSHDSEFWTGKDMTVYRHASDAPDGDIVEKGGVAQQLRNHWTTRQLLTCASGTCVGAPAAFTSDATGLPDGLIKWMRGEDNKDNENPSEYLANVRASIHGDVLHSRPAVLNYGGDDDIVVFYGANDGTLRAVRGGFGEDGGRELWSFIAPEFFGTLNNLYTNTSIGTTTGKPYFMDGGIGTFHTAEGGNITKAWIFPSMRRGGRTLYGMDVSSYENPQILWRRTGGVDDGYAKLGQTWSDPRITRTLANGEKPVLIFGGGYDAAYEDEQPRSGSATVGNTVFVVDAETGDVIWTASHDDMNYSIPSDVTLISRYPTNRRDGITDRAYVGDTGGNVWRIDMNNADPGNWRVHKLAELGSDRKFLYPPDVVYERDFDAILIGSGDREKPHDTSVANAFFMLKDAHEDPAKPWVIVDDVGTITLDELYDATDNAIQEGNDPEAAQAELDEKRGWIVHFLPGEKGVGSAVTLDGTTFFSTHQPQAAAAGSCSSNLGIARNYALSFRNATATREQDGQQGLTKSDRFEQIPGGGFIPSPVPVVVDIDGQLREVVLRGTQVDEGGTTQLNRRFRTFWYKEYE